MKTLYIALIALFVAVPVFGQSATVSWTTTYQTIDGFGASTGYLERNPNMTSAQADCFFSVANGACASGPSIGLGILRIQDSESGTNTPDLPTLKLAVARGAKIFLSFDIEYSFTTANFSNMATYMVNKMQYLQSNGIPVSYISPENEPINNASWTAALFDTYIKSYLHPALVAAGYGSIPLVLGEDWPMFKNDYVTPCMQDAAGCGQYVAIVAGHDYGWTAGFGFPNGYNCCDAYTNHPPPSSAAGKRVWQTEVMGGANGPCTSDDYVASYDPSMSDAIVWAQNIHDFLTQINGSSWQFWNFQAQTAHGLPNCNDGLTDSNFNPAKRFYALGNWSKYVRPGWTRIEATANPSSTVYVTAFKDTATGSFAIVAVNASSSTAEVGFTLAGFPSVSSVTPAITSSGYNLADQSSIAISGGAFNYSLPATSVTTFRGNASSTSTTRPASPMSLTAAVK